MLSFPPACATIHSRMQDGPGATDDNHRARAQGTPSEPEAASQAKICQPERWSSNRCSDRSFASSAARWRLGLTAEKFLFPAYRAQFALCSSSGAAQWALNKLRVSDGSPLVQVRARMSSFDETGMKQPGPN